MKKNILHYSLLASTSVLAVVAILLGFSQYDNSLGTSGVSETAAVAVAAVSINSSTTPYSVFDINVAAHARVPKQGDPGLPSDAKFASSDRIDYMSNFNACAIQPVALSMPFGCLVAGHMLPSNSVGGMPSQAYQDLTTKTIVAQHALKNKLYLEDEIAADPYCPNGYKTNSCLIGE